MLHFIKMRAHRKSLYIHSRKGTKNNANSKKKKEKEKRVAVVLTALSA